MGGAGVQDAEGGRTESRQELAACRLGAGNKKDLAKAVRSFVVRGMRVELTRRN